jgi:beta-phosphoglucomutase family hydrolase
MVKLKGAIFDLDGVITRTASIHFKAWKKIFDEYLEKHVKDKNKGEYRPFTYEEDYIPYVDGVPRYEGVRKFLESRDIHIKYGEPEDTPGMETCCGIGNRKNKVFKEIVEKGGVEIYDTTIKLIKDLKKDGIRVGVASSSKNCKFILEKVGLDNLFEEVIGGIALKEMSLRGKPHPDMFVVAAENMELEPFECLMVEDALAGVKAGKEGDFGLVIGVSRNGQTEQLLAEGADIAVEDMGEIDLKTIKDWFKEGIEEDSWNLTYYAYAPEEERLRETLTTVGNGYFATRGCIVSERANDEVHYPGTYVAGLFNKIPSDVHGKAIYNNDFVNCPNWLLIQIKIDEGDYIPILEQEILSYKQKLDFKNAVVSRYVLFKDEKGRETQIQTERILSMDNPHYAALRYKVTPKNYSGKITLKSSLDGNIINYGVARYRTLNSKHLNPLNAYDKDDSCFLEVETTASKVKILYKAKNKLYKDDKLYNEADKSFSTKGKGEISETFRFNAKEGETYRLEKLVSLYTSKDLDIESYEEAHKNSLEDVKTFDDIFKPHAEKWEELWHIADFKVIGDRLAQRVFRLHAYHLLVTASNHNKNIDAGLPARGLHGEAYRGHIFWDEIYIMPFYNTHFPIVSKSDLVYRYRRLDAARDYARENGYKGAMYPWQTADTGEEETQEIHYNPKSDTWGPDLSRRQRHVSIAISYNIWAYFYCTYDLDFIHNYGAEMIIEIARFWESISQYDEKTGKYHIDGVMGPDEFHEKYPGKSDEEAGLKDNAYTNIMVSWTLHKTIETIEKLPDEVKKQLKDKIGFEEQELERWKDIVSKMNVIIGDDNIISQFDGYKDLKELDWEQYRKKYDNIHRMDRILKAEGDSPDKYKVAKQGDVLMLFYLLAPEQVQNILNMMNYKTTDALKLIEDNYKYYIKRTSHGSTLSRIVHAGILKYLDHFKKEMWEHYEQALRSDIYDTQGGTTQEGIHTGVMAGTLDIVMKTFAGINFFKDHIDLNPYMPNHWKELSFKILYKDNLLFFEITHTMLRVKKIKCGKMDITVNVKGTTYELNEDQWIEVFY